MASVTTVRNLVVRFSTTLDFSMDGKKGARVRWDACTGSWRGMEGCIIRIAYTRCTAPLPVEADNTLVDLVI